MGASWAVRNCCQALARGSAEGRVGEACGLELPRQAARAAPEEGYEEAVITR